MRAFDRQHGRDQRSCRTTSRPIHIDIHIDQVPTTLTPDTHEHTNKSTQAATRCTDDVDARHLKNHVSCFQPRVPPALPPSLPPCMHAHIHKQHTRTHT
jgi:hypothetical protein